MKNDLLKLINIIDNTIYVNTVGGYAEGYTDALSMVSRILEDIVEEDFNSNEWEKTICEQIKPFIKKR